MSVSSGGPFNTRAKMGGGFVGGGPSPILNPRKMSFHDYSGSPLRSADSMFSTFTGLTHNGEDFDYEGSTFEEEEGEDLMVADDLALEEASMLCVESSVNSLISRQVLLSYNGTDVIQEGALIESGKMLIGDVIKNLLASGAVVLSGGMAGDTVVEVMYALERTKQVSQIYDSIVATKDIIYDFMNDVNRVPLENNFEQLNKVALDSAIKISQQVDTVAGKGTSKDALAKLRQTVEALRQKFLGFFRKMVSAVADWIGTLIPDDGGNISTFLKVTLVGVVEGLSEKPLSTVKSLVGKLPTDIQGIVFSQSGLQNFLIDLCNKIADGVETANENGTITSAIKGASGAAKGWYDMLGEKTPLGKGYDLQGAIGQFAGDHVGKIIGREDWNLGDKASTMMDPSKAFCS